MPISLCIRWWVLFAIKVVGYSKIYALDSKFRLSGESRFQYYEADHCNQFF